MVDSVASDEEEEMEDGQGLSLGFGNLIPQVTTALYLHSDLESSGAPLLTLHMEGWGVGPGLHAAGPPAHFVSSGRRRKPAANQEIK